MRNQKAVLCKTRLAELGSTIAVRTEEEKLAADLDAAVNRHGPNSSEVAACLENYAQFLRQQNIRLADALSMEAGASAITATQQQNLVQATFPKDQSIAPKVCKQCSHPNRQDYKFCGSCGIPLEEAQSENSMVKTCPFCAETIKAAAIKCRFCASDLRVAAAPRANPTRPTANSQPRTQAQYPYQIEQRALKLYTDRKFAELVEYMNCLYGKGGSRVGLELKNLPAVCRWAKALTKLNQTDAAAALYARCFEKCKKANAVSFPIGWAEFHEDYFHFLGQQRDRAGQKVVQQHLKSSRMRQIGTHLAFCLLGGVLIVVPPLLGALRSSPEQNSPQMQQVVKDMAYREAYEARNALEHGDMPGYRRHAANARAAVDDYERSGGK